MLALLSLGLLVLNGIVTKLHYDQYQLTHERKHLFYAVIWGICSVCNLFTAGLFVYVG